MRWRSAVTVAVTISALTAPAGVARAVMSNEPSLLAPSDDTDYAAGKAAFNAGDWRGAIANLTLVLIRRPWHDNAETMVAYSWRKLGDYDQALAHYATALQLNPHNRGALEYLAEAYLTLGRVDDANATFIELRKVCGTVVMAFDNNGWKNGCGELHDLEEAYAERGLPLPAAQ